MNYVLIGLAVLIGLVVIILVFGLWSDAKGMREEKSRYRDILK